MSRGKKRKRPGWQKRQRRKDEQTEEVRYEDVVVDTAGQFTCSTKIADDFAYQARSRIEDLESDLAFNRVAVEIWKDRPGRAAVLAEALAAFLAERERYYEALVQLRDRFEVLARDESFQHEHLEPVEPFQDLIRRRVFDLR